MSQTKSRSVAITVLGIANCFAFSSLARAADDAFVTKAAIGGMTEVAAGELATRHGNSDAVKKFGDHMVQDHTKANDELKALATTKKMAVPSKPDAEHQKSLDGLKAKSGSAFDSAFKAQMVKDHKDAVALFETEAKDGTDSDLKAFASKTLPTIKDHLKMVEAMK
jgi:putative membrane protein